MKLSEGSFPVAGRGFAVELGEGRRLWVKRLQPAQMHDIVAAATRPTETRDVVSDVLVSDLMLRAGLLSTEGIMVPVYGQFGEVKGEKPLEVQFVNQPGVGKIADRQVLNALTEDERALAIIEIGANLSKADAKNSASSPAGSTGSIKSADPSSNPVTSAPTAGAATGQDRASDAAESGSSAPPSVG